MSNYRCGICRSASGAPEWNARYHTLWNNQHGWKVRVFCSFCGAWTDIKLLYGSASGEQSTVIKKPDNGFYLSTYQDMKQHE